MPPTETEKLAYECFVLRRMIEQLPTKPQLLLLGQFDKVLAALNHRDATVRDKVSGLVEDVILNVKLQEFDLDATKRERNELRDRL